MDSLEFREITIKPMTAEMFYEYFREYENDPDLYLPNQEYVRYEYSEEKVTKYIQRQKDLDRVVLAIMQGDAIKSNTRSQHVMEKVGFDLIGEDDDFKYYCIDREHYKNA